MSPLLIIQLIQAGIAASSELISLYQQGKVVLSATDVKAIHDSLVASEAALAALRPQVDAALAAAAAKT